MEFKLLGYLLRFASWLLVKTKTRLLELEKAKANANPLPPPLPHNAVKIPVAGHVWNPLQTWPPNERCFCNSGKKAKKCCLPRQPRAIPVKDAQEIERAMKLGEPGKEGIRQAYQRSWDLLAKVRAEKGGKS